MHETPAIDAIPDKEIVFRALNGEKELYAIIVRRYNQRLYRIGMSMVNDDTEVEDIMQVAYIHAWENLAGFGFRSSLATWLTRIMINECLLRLKQKGKSIHMHDENIDIELQRQFPSAQSTPASHLQNTELRQLLETAIRQLPEKYRVVFVMREIEGMNVAETGDCLDITESNVKVRLNRAKSLLKDQLMPYYRDDVFHFHLNRCDRIVDNVMKDILGDNL